MEQDNRPMIEWTLPKMQRLQQAYDKATKAGAEQFTFDEQEYLTAYAFYLLAYLKTKLVSGS